MIVLKALAAFIGFNVGSYIAAVLIAKLTIGDD